MTSVMCYCGTYGATALFGTFPKLSRCAESLLAISFLSYIYDTLKRPKFRKNILPNISKEQGVQNFSDQHLLLPSNYITTCHKWHLTSSYSYNGFIVRLFMKWLSWAPSYGDLWCTYKQKLNYHISAEEKVIRKPWSIHYALKMIIWKNKNKKQKQTLNFQYLFQRIPSIVNRHGLINPTVEPLSGVSVWLHKSHTLTWFNPNWTEPLSEILGRLVFSLLFLAALTRVCWFLYIILSFAFTIFQCFFRIIGWTLLKSSSPKSLFTM